MPVATIGFHEIEWFQSEGPPITLTVTYIYDQFSPQPFAVGSPGGPDFALYSTFGFFISDESTLVFSRDVDIDLNWPPSDAPTAITLNSGDAFRAADRLTDMFAVIVGHGRIIRARRKLLCLP